MSNLLYLTNNTCYCKHVCQGPIMKNGRGGGKHKATLPLISLCTPVCVHCVHSIIMLNLLSYLFVWQSIVCEGRLGRGRHNEPHVAPCYNFVALKVLLPIYCHCVWHPSMLCGPFYCWLLHIGSDVDQLCPPLLGFTCINNSPIFCRWGSTANARTQQIIQNAFIGLLKS